MSETAAARPLLPYELLEGRSRGRRRLRLDTSARLANLDAARGGGSGGGAGKAGTRGSSAKYGSGGGGGSGSGDETGPGAHDAVVWNEYYDRIAAPPSPPAALLRASSASRSPPRSRPRTPQQASGQRCEGEDDEGCAGGTQTGGPGSSWGELVFTLHPLPKALRHGTDYTPHYLWCGGR